MTKKEKEKIVYSAIKSVAKTSSWKFKSYFAYKTENNFLYSIFLIADVKKMKLLGWISFKPNGIDDIFWEVINEKRNIEFPLSYRIECAVKIDSLTIDKFEIDISFEKIDEQIKELFVEFDRVVNKTINKYQTINEYITLLVSKPRLDTTSLLTCLILLGDLSLVINKIADLKSENISPGFSYLLDNTVNYYTLVEKYCQNKSE